MNPDSKSSRMPTGGQPLPGQNESKIWICLLIMLGVKPIIDLFWDYEIISLGGIALNPPRFVGIMVFLAALFLVGKLNALRAKGSFLILLFLLLHLIATGKAYLADEISITVFANTNLRLFDAYMIYLIAAKLWSDPRQIYRLAKVIWISVLLVNVISVTVWRTGEFNESVTGGVGRFAGLYNDAGGPSYNAVFAFVFAAFYISGMRTRNQKTSIFEKTVFVLTILVSVVLLVISITKSAFLMMAVFVFLWWGIHKNKHYLIIPSMILGGYYVYAESSDVQKRLENEVNVIVEGDYSDKAIRSMGTGRVSVWMNLLDYYSQVSWEKKAFGLGRSFGAHNQFLGYLLRVGALGLTVFLLMLIQLFYYALKAYSQTKSPEVFFGISLMSMFVALGMTGEPFDYTTMYWYVLIIFSFINAPVFSRRPSNPNRIPQGGSIPVRAQAT